MRITVFFGVLLGGFLLAVRVPWAELIETPLPVPAAQSTPSVCCTPLPSESIAPQLLATPSASEIREDSQKLDSQWHEFVRGLQGLASDIKENLKEQQSQQTLRSPRKSERQDRRQ